MQVAFVAHMEYKNTRKIQ